MNEAFKALSDPTRRKILHMLKEKELCAGEISDAFDMSKPSVTHHLNILTQSGLILREKKGQNVYYSLNTTVFQDVVQWFFNFKKRGDKNE